MGIHYSKHNKTQKNLDLTQLNDCEGSLGTMLTKKLTGNYNDRIVECKRLLELKNRNKSGGKRTKKRNKTKLFRKIQTKSNIYRL
jgi:hypothetical protein